MERHRNQASFPSPTLRSIEDPNEGWQVVRPCRVRCFVASVAPKPRYLAATVGRCLNCLSSSCRRADCRLPTRCFNCHGFQHHLRDCMLPRNSPAVLWGGGSEASYDTLPSLGDKDTSSALESSLSNASSFLEFDHIFFVSSVYSFPRSCDPMVEEAALGASVGTPCRSCNEEVVSMVEQPTNPPPTTLSLCLSNLLLPIEDIQTPVMFRSEDEQLAGHELIKALRNFKLSSVSPLSPSNRHEPSLNNEAIVVHSKETQSCYP
jgi:hypothetical protein